MAFFPLWKHYVRGENQCVCSHLFLAGEVPLTISIEPSVVLVEDQVTLSCQVTDNVPSNTSVLWYKMEKGRDAPLCSSSSLGGVVEQCKDEDEWRIVGHWKGRALLLVIQQVQVADEGTYVCALNGSAVMQEATTHLGVTGKQGDFHSEMWPAMSMLSSVPIVTLWLCLFLAGQLRPCHGLTPVGS